MGVNENTTATYNNIRINVEKALRRSWRKLP